MKKIFLLYLFLFFYAYSVCAQIKVSASIDSVQMFIGEQAKLSIQAIHPQDYILEFPIFNEFIVDNLELVEALSADTQQLDNGLLQVTNEYIVTSFDSALVYMPGFEIKAGEDIYMTNPLSIKIVDMPIDTTQQAIADIKDVYNPPIDWMFYFTIVGLVIFILLLLALVGYVVARYLKGRVKQEQEEIIVIDPRKAHEIALEELDLLKQKQLWQKQQFKNYYTELTEILRRYIFNRYAIDAMEQTSDDVITEFRQNKELKDKKEEIKLLLEVLQLADLVKFAKWQPFPDDCERSYHQVIEFIDKTKEIETDN